MKVKRSQKKQGAEATKPLAKKRREKAIPLKTVPKFARDAIAGPVTRQRSKSAAPKNPIAAAAAKAARARTRRGNAMLVD